MRVEDASRDGSLHFVRRRMGDPSPALAAATVTSRFVIAL